MRKTILYIAMSLDGYIADKNGGVDWLEGDGSDTGNEGSYGKFIDTVDTVVMGYKTYNQIVMELSPDKWFYEGLKTYVITHRKIENNKNVNFINGSIEEAITELKNNDGKNIWICGGAKIVNELIDMGLIDIICVSIIPTLIGGGIRLFGERTEKYGLKFISSETYNGITDLVYELKK